MAAYYFSFIPIFSCKNETETQMWANTEELLQALRHSWIHHANTGVRIYAFKCLQLLVSLESKRERKTEDPKVYSNTRFRKMPVHSYCLFYIIGCLLFESCQTRPSIVECCRIGKGRHFTLGCPLRSSQR
jgi:hypothetical protein